MMSDRLFHNHLFLAGAISAILISLGIPASAQDPGKITIALSKGYPVDKYANYYRWIQEDNPDVTCIDLYNLPDDSAIIVFQGCDGLLLTGGTDVFPGYYGKESDSSRCWAFDRKLDELEIRLIGEAIGRGIPVLGICRGQQMMNVALGGSLIVDLPSDRPSFVHHQCDDYLKCYHSIRLENGALLYQIAGGQTDSVTTNHHQAIDRLSSSLEPVAWAPDGIIEAVQWKEPAGKSFLLGVQWHPERMSEDSPLSAPIRIRFIKEAIKYSVCRLK